MRYHSVSTWDEYESQENYNKISYMELFENAIDEWAGRDTMLFFSHEGNDQNGKDLYFQMRNAANVFSHLLKLKEDEWEQKGKPESERKELRNIMFKNSLDHLKEKIISLWKQTIFSARANIARDKMKKLILINEKFVPDYWKKEGVIK